MGIIYLTKEEFDNLLEYSRSIPTGTTIGKQWKCNHNSHLPDKDASWFLGEYYDIGDKEYVGIRWKKIELSQPLKSSFEIAMEKLG